MKFNRRIIFSIILVALLIAANISYAADFGLVSCAAGNDKCTLEDLVHVVIKFINFLIGAAWLVAVLFVFWGAYGLITSYGNSESIEKNKDVIQKAIIGFFLIMVAFILINWLVIVLGGYSFQEVLKFLPFFQ